MQVVIISAGKDKRMGDLTKVTPKPMLKIKGKPILEHKLNALPKEITEVIFIVGYKGEHIMNYFKKEFGGRKVTYVFQRDLNGTGTALHLAKSFLGEKFLVMNGDDLYHKKDIKKIIKHDLAILGHVVEDVTKFGIMRTDKKGCLIDIVEKPKKSKDNLANIGLYMLNKKIFAYDLARSSSGEFYLTDMITALAGDQKIKIEKSSLWHPIGNPDDLKKAEEIIHKFA